MNKTMLWIAGLLVVVVGYTVVGRRQTVPTDTLTTQSGEMMEKTDTNDDAMVKDESVMKAGQSRYVVYSRSAFDEAAGKKRVLFFHAPWCPTCRPADAEFQKNASAIPENVILFKTDYDSSTELKKQYAITYQHTYVLVDDQGSAVKKWNGGAMDELIANTE